jgi:cyclopropane fatty-acyl-phospholipid synthase-like methyltransferase
MKQFSEACEQNKDPILSVIHEEFRVARNILEIGSGTGQHAVYFGQHLPHLQWQTSDLSASHASINAWIYEAGLANVLSPLELDVAADTWPDTVYDGVFSANTAHIMSWPMVEQLFAGVGRMLQQGASLCLYGPFNYDHAYTSPSNARFDAWLRDRDPESGVRDFEELDALAAASGMQLKADHEMPVNNRLLVWIKQENL